ncbi:alanine:cation symporter family protein [Thermobrachium celere]|uniref:alanine:cation symporter family protein n=1 Tax=Thermobrachium celere TaxID=53422 RepID=UPI003BF96CA2
MGVLFSILITICFGLVFNSVQANTISQAFQKAFGIQTYITGSVIAIITAFIIFGGIKRIAKTADAKSVNIFSFCFFVVLPVISAMFKSKSFRRDVMELKCCSAKISVGASIAA